MFNDLGPLEVATLVLLSVLIFGPDKLPKVIQDVTGFIRKIKSFSDSAKQDIRAELGPEFKDFDFEDLNPKTFIRKQLGSDGLGLEEIRDSLDLRKELTEVTEAVNSRRDEPSSGSESASSVPGGARHDLNKDSGPVLEKASSSSAARDSRPRFDDDTT
ncbi:sec-independent translocase (plasmid) [Streptomyces sp. NBC_01298]|uniref:sec-independent translocase n=1 Tax=Streptomyces sp. NBC_01298 TaxID=2903817 RepID=UPI002E14572F|nr:sec-independent translocase [Streptomyces sp. NBC_01298]